MEDISLFRGYNKMSNKGRDSEIKVHFTFVLDLFASARRPIFVYYLFYTTNIRVILLFILVV